MARLEVDFPEDLLSEILTEDTKDLCKQIVDSASPILEEAVKKEMRAVIQHPGDSEAVDSIKASEAVESKNGAIISFTGPTGKSTNYYYLVELWSCRAACAAIFDQSGKQRTPEGNGEDAADL